MQQVLLLILRLLLKHHFLTFFLKSKARSSLHFSHENYWNSTLESLTAQNKFLDIVTLEQSYPLLKRLMYSLPENQLSLLLQATAGCDTLPRPLNQARWNIIVSPTCFLCQSTQPCFNWFFHFPWSIKGGTLYGMTLFYRLSFATVRRIYCICYNIMLIFLAARQVFIP